MKSKVKTTRMIIEELAKEYLKDPEYVHGFINGEWVDRITNELKLKDLSDLELSNMWDMVYLTLENIFHYYDMDVDTRSIAIKYLDVKSAFLEVVNMDARRRQKEKKEKAKMKVVVLSNGKLQVKEIENNLKSLQDIVDGHIEIPFLSKKLFQYDIDIIINEEGKFIEGMKKEIALINHETNQVLDIIYGNCIFASHDEHGNTVSLNEEQIKIVMDELSCNVILNNGSESFTLKALFV